MEQQIQTQKCTNCKVTRSLDNFIGKFGNILKTCLKCREKDAKQKQHPDVINKKNKRQNEKKYYIKYRENKRSENEEVFLKHTAEVQKKWRCNNKEHLAKWQTSNFRARFYAIKQQAQKKGILWNENLTDEICYKLMNSNCFYCNHIPEKSLNGIDRMNAMKHYEKSNVVSCCKHCNFMKGSLDTNTFVKRCQHISKHFGGMGDYNKHVWYDSQSVSYNIYLNRAQNKNLEFSLTKEDFDKFIYDKCYYCDKHTSNTHINGIDRKNNNFGYNSDNCVTCCSQCNYMKGSLNDTEFINNCKKVSEYILKNNIDVPEIEICTSKITKRHDKYDIPKTSISIRKLQPNKEIVYKHYEETTREIGREYKRNNNLPSDCKIKLEDIPKHCYYAPATEKRGDSFCVNRTHPKTNGKDWRTTTSKLFSTEEKYKQLLAYLNDTQYEPIQNIKIVKESRQVVKKEIVFSNEVWIEIFKMKNIKNLTTEEASKQIKNDYNIYIRRDIISKIWKNEIQVPEELQQTSEYKDMIENSKLRTKKSTKFTEDEIKFVKEIKHEHEHKHSLAEIARLFEEKFNKTITRTYISKL
jgi:hypothetical protein